MKKELVFLTGLTLLFSFCGKDSSFNQIIENQNTVAVNINENDPEPEINFLDLAPKLPRIPFHYELDKLPGYFITSPMNFFDSEPTSNQITDAGATLGRVLFYDKRLSANNTISCASCHKQEKSFADNGAVSFGIDNIPTKRNSMSLINMKWNRRMFWDQRTFGLENQVLQPIEHPEEMAQSLEVTVDKLSSTPFYPLLFFNAFGENEITSDKIALALSQFLRSIASYRSKYDEGLLSDFQNFNDNELRGKDLFFSTQMACNQCHQTVNFSLGNASNTGFSLDYEDHGIGDVTGNDEDMDRFKVPTLRNIELTAPYMHDGRFNSLEEVVNHYDHEVKPHRNLGDQLTSDSQTGGIPKIHNLPEEDKQALVTFLKTFTDMSIIEAEKFSDPFTAP